MGIEDEIRNFKASDGTTYKTDKEINDHLNVIVKILKVYIEANKVATPDAVLLVRAAGNAIIEESLLFLEKNGVPQETITKLTKVLDNMIICSEKKN